MKNRNGGQEECPRAFWELHWNHLEGIFMEFSRYWLPFWFSDFLLKMWFCENLIPSEEKPGFLKIEGSKNQHNIYIKSINKLCKIDGEQVMPKWLNNDKTWSQKGSQKQLKTNKKGIQKLMRKLDAPPGVFSASPGYPSAQGKHTNQQDTYR